MKTKLAIVLVLAVVTTASASALAQAEPLAGSEWRPTEIEGATIADDAGIFLQFAADGKVQGSGGCNNFAGSYEIDGEAISVGPLAATRMMCPGPVSDNEDRFFAALQKVAVFERERIRLTLKDDEGNVVVEFIQTDAD
jgi:putative lipoprotein